MRIGTLPDSACTGDSPMDLNVVRDVSRAVSAAHLFIYLVPETAEEAAELGVTDRGPAYLAFRSAAGVAAGSSSGRCRGCPATAA